MNVEGAGRGCQTLLLDSATQGVGTWEEGGKEADQSSPSHPTPASRTPRSSRTVIIGEA